VPTESLRGKIALIGASAPGLFDLRSTPVGADNISSGPERLGNVYPGSRFTLTWLRDARR